MAEYTEHDIFRSAIDTYGEVMQITVAFEEMSELQKELCSTYAAEDRRKTSQKRSPTWRS